MQAQGGPVSNLAGQLTVRDDTGTVVVERDLDPLFAATPTLTPGADLVFDNVALDFDAPFPGFASTGGTAAVDITGQDSAGDPVSASASADVATGDTVPVNGTCTTNDTTACALDDRFMIDVDWRDTTNGGAAPARVAPGGRFLDGGRVFLPRPEQHRPPGPGAG